MCGIIGYVGKKQAVPIIVEGLKKLEYRGYDSAGLAIYDNSGFKVAKKRGRLAELEKHLKKDSISGTMGIGHTRWATHGEPSDINSHPHLSQNARIAVVHNGIIENYKQLKEKLEKKGVKFTSATDSEVVAQLAEYYYTGDLVQTLIKVASVLEGSYALGIMQAGLGDTLVAIKKNNPLIIGLSEHGNFIASDVPAVLKHTKTVHYLDDGEIAILKKDSISFLNLNGEIVEKQPETIAWSLESAEKDGYPHFMLKEIYEQPKVVENTLNSALSKDLGLSVIDKIDIKKYNKIVITGCGSAYNAGFVSKYVFEKLCRFNNIEIELASEFRYKDPIVDKDTLVILISQSGETADTIAALKEAKNKGATTLAIVNVVGSAMSKLSDYCLFTAAGPEISVATTKAFSAQLVLLYVLAIKFAKQLGKIDVSLEKSLLAELATIPKKIDSMLKDTDAVQKIAASSITHNSIFFIGRNIDYAIALEGSLKLKEISYIHSEAYAGGELKHGTIALIEENTLVVAIATCCELFGKTLSNAEQVLSRGATVLIIGDCDKIGCTNQMSGIKLPEIDSLFSPSLSVIILQLFSYYVAANKGLDIDKPRNLAKSVTVE